MLKIFANYGAMFPMVELTIKSITNGVAIATDTDDSETYINVEDIRDSRPTSGSPIGIYWNSRDAY